MKSETRSEGTSERPRFCFPRWTHQVPFYGALSSSIGLAGLIAGIAYWFSPTYTDAGYQPVQPLPFSHKLHAGELGLDCRHCHNTVEQAALAAVPPTATCLACHDKLVLPESVKLAPVRVSAATGASIAWVRVHLRTDYTFFDHSVHVAAGVGCATCHGRVDQMQVVHQAQPLSMSWCLDCHRAPREQLRPLHRVTEMTYDARQSNYDVDRDPQRRRSLRPPQHCSGCHR